MYEILVGFFTTALYMAHRKPQRQARRRKYNTLTLSSKELNAEFQAVYDEGLFTAMNARPKDRAR